MRLLLCAVLLSTQFATSAQDSSSTPSSFPFNFNHLAIAVQDLGRAANFYSHVLGLKEITNRPNDANIRWFSLGEGKELHLIFRKQSAAEKPKEMHLAVSTQSFDGLIAFLKKEKIPYSDWPGTAGKINMRSDGIRQIYLQDPDGYWIEVNDVKQ